MVFNSLMVISVANISTEIWQQLACIPHLHGLTSPQLFQLLLSFPIHQLGHFALCLCTFFCHFSSPYNINSDSDFDSDSDSSSSSSSSSISFVAYDLYYADADDYDSHSD